MAKGHGSVSKADLSDISAALAAMKADELRETVNDILLELDDRAHDRVVDRLIERAARNTSRWAPASPSDATIAEVIGFAEAA